MPIGSEFVEEGVVDAPKVFAVEVVEKGRRKHVEAVIHVVRAGRHAVDHAAAIFEQRVDVGQDLGQVENVLDGARFENRVEAPVQLLRQRQIEVRGEVGAFPAREVEALHLGETKRTKKRHVVDAADGGQIRYVRRLRLDFVQLDSLGFGPGPQLAHREVDGHARKQQHGARKGALAGFVEQQAADAARDSHGQLSGRASSAPSGASGVLRPSQAPRSLARAAA